MRTKLLLAVAITLTVIGLSWLVININTDVELYQLDGRTKQAEIETLNKLNDTYEQKLEKAEGNSTELEKLRLEQQLLQDENTRLQSELQAKRNKQAQDARNVAVAVSVEPPVNNGGRVDWLRAVGIKESDWGYVDYIVGHEAGWGGVTRWNGAGSGAYGICQSLPASKMATAGADYMTNGETQLRWCNSYAMARYGSWASAYNFWINNHWW